MLSPHVFPPSLTPHACRFLYDLPPVLCFSSMIAFNRATLHPPPPSTFHYHYRWKTLHIYAYLVSSQFGHFDRALLD